jgi:hypothetical protein
MSVKGLGRVITRWVDGVALSFPCSFATCARDPVNFSGPQLRLADPIQQAPVETSGPAFADASRFSRCCFPLASPILTASALAVVHRELIITLAAQHKLPAVYYRHQRGLDLLWL